MTHHALGVRRRRSGPWLFVASLLCGAAVTGCRHNEGDSVVVTQDGSRLPSEVIDNNPLSLLPSAPVVLFWADAKAFFASAFGNELNRVISTRFPLPVETGFVPNRDVRAIVGGVYSMAGADVVAVLTGDFNPDLIRSTADKQAANASGAPGGVAPATAPAGATARSASSGGGSTSMPPMVRTSYAGNDLYTVKNLGFSIVTKHTALVGNETGLRRALDRIRDNRLNRDVPEWMARLLESPQAAFVVAGDVAAQPAVSALANQAPFLNGMRSFRVLGNFQTPGLNLAGALSYPDPAGAAAAASSLRALAQQASMLSVLSLFGLGAPLQTMQVEVRESDAQFVLAVDARTVVQLMSFL